jgi:AAA family ATP:ADP antiporter
MTSEFIRRFGIRFTLLIFPMILLLGSLGIAVFISLSFAIFLKGSDKSLSYSLNQSVRELLYIPVSPDLKYKAKIFIDMFLNRSAKGIGSVILLILLQFNIGMSPVSLVSLVSVVLILCWMIVNLKVGREYVSTVKLKLMKKWDRADKWVAEKVDVDYTKLVFDTLESKNRSSVLYAMHLFDLLKKNKMSPELEKLLSYKSDEMKISSLGALFEEEDTAWLPQIDDSLDEEVLEKEVKEIMSLDVYQEVMKGYVDKTLREQGQKAETAKMELAKAIGLMETDASLVEELGGFLEDESPEVGKYAMESAAIHKKREYVPGIIQKMKSPVTREDALFSLEKYGAKIVGILSDYLGDREEDVELRKGAARLLASIGTQEASDFLMLELAEARGDLDTEIIDSLDRIRTEKSGIQFRESTVKVAIIREVKRSCRLIIDISSSSEIEGGDKGSRLEGRLDEAKRNVFRLLGLIYPKEDIVKAYQNIRAGTKDSMAYAVELLDNTLQREMKILILPLVEELSAEDRAKMCRAILRSLPED